MTGATEVDRLAEASQLWERVDEHYLTDDVRNLERTLRSLVGKIPHEQQEAS